jgi:hypothetical protein
VSSGLTSANTRVTGSPKSSVDAVAVDDELLVSVDAVLELDDELLEELLVSVVLVSGAVTPQAVMLNTSVAHTSADKIFFFIINFPPF